MTKQHYGWPKFYQDYATSKGKSAENIANRLSQDVRLQEMEEQLIIAENLCTNLKDQLDHMKKLHENNNEFVKPKLPNKKTVYSVCNPSAKRNPMDILSYSKSTEDRSKTSLSKNEETLVLERQNSKAISAGTSNAAVQTINNILNGITDSLNRLSQLHVHIKSETNPISKKVNQTRDFACGDDTPMTSVDIASIPKPTEFNEAKQEAENPAEKQPFCQATGDICHHSSTVLSIKSKTTTTRKKKIKQRLSYNNKAALQNSTKTLNIINKRSLRSTAKHVEKEFNIEPVKMIKKDSPSILLPERLKRGIRSKRFKAVSNVEKNKSAAKHAVTETNKLVELYYNNAAKGSDTDESNPELRGASNNEERKCKPSKEPKQQKSSTETIPSLPLDYASESNIGKQAGQNQPQYQCDSMHSHYNSWKQVAPVAETVYMKTAARTEYCSICSKNYELPTIASKMKQVAKSYLRRFNCHSIPFCAATSTSPSHNVGINIQQVMGLIKIRQPIPGISPTLAHNIGLAAEKLQRTPLTTMLSLLGSHTYARSQCPSMKPNLNYQHLQEMAKDMPDEQYDGSMKNMSEEAMACGDQGGGPVWTVDPVNRKNCTCVPQRGVGFQQVLSRYSSNLFSVSTVSQFNYRSKTRYNRTAQTAKPKNKLSLTRSPTKPINNKSALKGKEKKLKEVLTNLRDEFSYINEQYEVLSKRVETLGPDADEKTVKQLEHRKRCLNNKEEEITMVMSLYKENVALKQQIKTRKERESIASISLNMQPPYSQLQNRYDLNSFN